MSPDGRPNDLHGHQRNMVQNTMKILDHEDAVLKRDPDHWEVIALRTPSRRVPVHRSGDQFRCRSDKENNQDRPCAHILAVLIYEGIVDLPGTAGEVWKKTNDDRNHTAETKAWELVPTKLPELLAELLRAGLPLVEAPPELSGRGGRPRKPVYTQVYQAIMRVAWRQSLRSARGTMRAADHRTHNPYGDAGIATISRFLAKPDTTTVHEKLLALTTAPARSFETLVHPDGTGLTEQHFSAYFDQRYAKKEKTRRDHHWTFAEILWTYRYTMVAATPNRDRSAKRPGLSLC
jgi:hypothetical protein